MNLTQKDFKLLTYLFHNGRESISKIAKQTELSREQVTYRLNKYIKQGLIKKFFPIINYSKLGYNSPFALLLKFDKSSLQKQFIKKINNSKYCISWGYIYGKYDLYMNIIFKNKDEFEKYLSQLLEKKEILDYFILDPTFTKLYPLKFFNYKKPEYQFTQTSEKIKIDNTDLKILKALNQDFRMKLIDIAEKVEISPELTLHRLRKLQKEKIILGSRIQFNSEKLGYHFSMIILNIRNFSETNKNKIKQFARQSRHTISLMFSLSKPNCFIQLYHKEEQELRNTIQEIKQLFAEEIIDLDLMLITDESEEINTLPFLE